MFRVHIGYTPTGRDKWRTFATLDAATKACALVFERTGVILSIVKE